MLFIILYPELTMGDIEKQISSSSEKTLENENEKEEEPPLILKEEKDDRTSGAYDGKCKWFSDKSGYGFITVETNGELKHKEIFVHFTGIKPFVSSAYKTILCGEYVNFDVIKGNNGLQAVNVTGIFCGPLLCDTNPNIKHIVPKSKIATTQTKIETPSTNVGQYVGKCKWFNEKSGYGFIMVESGDKIGTDVFVHYTDITPLISSYKTLVSGEYLSFDIIKGTQDLQAVNVKGFMGGTLMCDVNHIPKPKK